jgi:ubiquitin-protein ligase E3 C
MKLRMQVKMKNAIGLDEAGIDGGGITREFLNELLKTAFDPNRGFFRYSYDKLLYPNPQATVLEPDPAKFAQHYFFLGRILGKAIYEKMLVELPFAAFFLSKILGRHGNVDIHHLVSLDPELYRNLLVLKQMPDVSDMGLDFTVVNNDLGKTHIEELKPGGRDIVVSNSNKIEYIHLMSNYKLNRQVCDTQNCCTKLLIIV